jgi:hypothetical protein|tara:strand:- start:261 stop:491 length:231 start_codon:yes stop_codon:yes gene_type:complete
MKAILEFNLPNDKWEFKMANESAAMHSVLWDMDQWLRAQTKYAPDSMSEDTYNAFDECRKQLHEFLNNEYINLNEE